MTKPPKDRCRKCGKFRLLDHVIHVPTVGETDRQTDQGHRNRSKYPTKPIRVCAGCAGVAQPQAAMAGSSR